MKLSITDKLQSGKPVLEIYGKEFEIDNRKDTVLTYAEQNFKSMKTGEVMEETIRHFAGENALKEIRNMKELSFRDYEKIASAIMSLAMEIPFEEAEARFQKSAGNQN